MLVRTRRHTERGQAVPIAALFSVLMLAGAALAVDLSLQTDHHLDLQNASDAAALVGARDLGKSNGGLANQADRNTAAVDALRVVYDHMGWGSAGTSWATSAVGSTCGQGLSGNDCHVIVTGPGTASNVTVEVDVPPRNAHNTSYNESPASSGTPWGYVEVDVAQRDRSNFGAAVGFRNEVAGAHSVGYHYPSGQPFGFALYSGTLVSGGNDGEIIEGNVYAYRDVQPQSNGLAGFCSDTDSSGNAGHIVLGAPQYGSFPSPDPAAGAPYQHDVNPDEADVLTHVSACSTGNTAKHVSQTAALGSCGSLVVQGVSMSTSQDSRSLACMANPAITPPDLQGPSLTGNVVYEDGSQLANGQSVLTVTTPLAQGLYYVTHNPNCAAPSCTDVVIDGHSAQNNCTGSYSSAYNVCMLGVTFWLDKGATIGVSNGAKVVLSPYQPPNDTSQNPNDGHFSIYAPAGSAAGVYESNVQSVLVLMGTLYMPSGSMTVGQNAILSIVGQAVVESWNVQSGNFTNPEITYDPHAVATQREVLQLVE
jgi:Flp pilus assembly protein TadG